MNHLNIVLVITSKSFKLNELAGSCSNFPRGKTILKKNVSDSSKHFTRIFQRALSLRLLLDTSFEICTRFFSMNKKIIACTNL